MLSALLCQNFRVAVAVPNRTAPLRFSVFARTASQHNPNVLGVVGGSADSSATSNFRNVSMETTNV